jgi:hypothetical protein
MATFKSLDFLADPECERITHQHSYSLDDWRGRLILGVLQNALDEYLGKKVKKEVRKEAAQFLFEDNEVLELCLQLIHVDKDYFRKQINKMRKQGERLRKPRNN